MNLIDMREESGLTQEQVSKKLNIHRDTLRSIEKGNSSLKAEHLPILSELYQKPIDYLLNICLQMQNASAERRRNERRI